MTVRFRSLKNPDARGESAPSGKSNYEITVMLIRALAWPAIVLLLLFIFRGPVKAIVGQLPSLMASSNSISIAGVSVQVDRKLRSQASADALASMGALSPEGVRSLMGLAEKTPIYKEEDWKDGRVEREYGEILRAGLAEAIPWGEERGLGPGAKGVRVAERGRRVQELAYLIIADFAGQLSAAARSAASPAKE
jgi:hypothetical protein